MTLLPPIEIRRLGRVEYGDGLRLQERVSAAVVAGRMPDTFLLLEHDHVLTLGRGADGSNVLFPPEELAARGVELHETGRGGDVTYHGPGQIVGYPIFHLGASRETKDVRKFVRNLEEVMIRTCADYGIAATRVEKLTGVWVGDEKIGAIGVRVSKWVTSHGFALNVGTDLSYFDLIVPCGIPGKGVTSISRLAGRDVPIADVEDRLEHHAGDVFARDLARKDVDLTTIGVVLRRPISPLPSGGGGRAQRGRGRAPEHQYLCLKRTPARGGFWQIVTGRIEPGETPRQAAARELFEETGLRADVRPLDYEHAFALELPGRAPDDPPLLGREIVFLADAPAGFEATRAAEEHDELRWLPLEDALELVHHAGHRRALRHAGRFS